MKVLVTGYYGKQNAGDDLLQSAISELFAPHRMLFTSWLPEIDTLRSADVIVIGGGSIWPGNGFFPFGDRLPKQIGRPIMVIGISARGPCEQTLKKTRSLIRQARFFHVRDHHTAEYFDVPATVRCGPDLFWWSPFGVKECADARVFSNVLVNLREWRELAWNPEGIIQAIRQSGRNAIGWPLHFGSPEPPQSRGNDLEFTKTSGLPVNSLSFQWQEVLSSRYVIAMRFHAVQIAIRLERPVIGFDYHPKIRAFFHENGLPELCVPLTDFQALQSAIKKLEAHFEEYREKTIRLKRRLLIESETLRRDLRAEVERIAAETASSPPRHTAIDAMKRTIRSLRLQ